MSTEDDFTAGVNAAAALLDKMADDYASEHSTQDSETGVWEFGRHGEDYYNTLRELADDIRGLVHGNSRAAAGVGVPQAPSELVGWQWRMVFPTHAGPWTQIFSLPRTIESGSKAFAHDDVHFEIREVFAGPVLPAGVGVPGEGKA